MRKNLNASNQTFCFDMENVRDFPCKPGGAGCCESDANERGETGVPVDLSGENVAKVNSVG
jgi:hypothetical protein